MNLRIDDREAYAYTGGKPFDAGLPTVVLIHGALDDHSVWGLQSRWLAHHGCSVLAVDLPGHGRSAGPALASVGSLGAWLADVVRAAGVTRAVLAGHSMGSLIALEAAARLGDRTTGLVLIGTAFPMAVSTALLETALDDPMLAIDRVNALSHSSLASKPSAPAPGFWLRGNAKALNRRNQRNHDAAGHGNLFHLDFAACNDYQDGLQTASRVRCPVTLVVGERDLMTPASASRALSEALRAEVVQAPAGHALMGEAPLTVLEAIRGHLPGTAAPTISRTVS